MNYNYTCNKTIDINQDLCGHIEARLAINGYTWEDGSRIVITPERIKAAISKDWGVGTTAFRKDIKYHVLLNDLIMDEIDDIFYDDNKRFVHFVDEDYDDVDYYDKIIGG
jgi:hypothetical protein